MKAVICRELGSIGALRVEDVPTPRLASGQALIDVKACGVNFPDLLIVEGKYQLKPPMPFTPGGEVAGIVREVAPGVEAVKPGDAVIALLPWGGFAEQVAVDASRLFRIPAAADLVAAASFGTAYGTSFYALRDRAELRAGETLLVLGAAGGVGLAAVEIGKLMGARVIAAASSEDKLALCKQYGADAVINYTQGDFKQSIKALAPEGVDVVYDPVGGAYTEAAVRATGWNGRVLVVGFTTGEIPRIPVNLLLLKSCSLVGVFWGAYLLRDPVRGRALMEETVGLLADGKLKPHIHATYPLERGGDALREVAERRVRGKIALRVS